MEALANLKNRRSIRKYKDTMVPKEVLEQIMEAGLYAASGMNRQPVIMIAVTNKEMRDRMSKLNAQVMGSDKDPFYGAPCLIVVLAEREMRNRVYDGSLVMGNLMQAAHDLGVGSCWIHRAKEVFDTEEGKEILKSIGVEGDYEGIGNCILGYVDGEYPQAAPRKENRIFWIE